MPTIFSGGLNQCLSPSITWNTGGNLSKGTRYFAIQARNAAGVNLPSDVVRVDYETGDQLIISCPAENRTEGTQFIYYFLLCGTTNNVSDMTLCGLWRNYNGDGTTIRPFYDIEITHDHQIKTPPAIVSTIDDLPSNPIEGQPVLITTGVPVSAYYIYAPWLLEDVDNARIIENSAGKWCRHNGPVNYGSFPIGNTEDTFGCHTPTENVNIELIAQDPLFPTPEYFPDGSDNVLSGGQPARLSFANYEVSAYEPGRRLQLKCFIDGQPSTNRLSERVFVTVLGFVNPTTGELIKTRNDGTSNIMSGVGSPLQFNSAIGFFVLERELPFGWHIVCEISLAAKASEAQLLDGQVVSFALYIPLQAGVLIPGGRMFRTTQGGLIYDELDNMRIVPSINGAKALSTIGGLIHGTSDRVYEFAYQPEQLIFGLATNTANQKVAVTQDGRVVVRDTLQPLEAILGFADTLSGETLVDSWSSAINLTDQGLTIRLYWPETVTASHPDSGGKPAEFGYPQFRMYLKVGEVLYRQNTPTNTLLAVGEFQEIEVNTLSGFTIVGEVTQPPVTNFGMFDSPLVETFAATGSITGLVSVGISYILSGSQLSWVNQSETSGCLPIRSSENLYVSEADMWRLAVKAALTLG